MIFIGIDPGYTGAVVAIATGGEIVERMSGFDSDEPYMMFVALRHMCRATHPSVRIAIEKTNAQPKFGAKAAYQFGGAAMVARLAAQEVKHPVEYVVPRTWQKIYWGKVADTKKQARVVCKQLWPGRDWKHSGECDAALLAEFLRRRELGVNDGILRAN